VSQQEPRVERYQRHGERDWLLSEQVGLDSTINLRSIGCVLALRNIYDRVF
jgi:hypothetical protein